MGLPVITLYKLDILLEMVRACPLNLFCFSDKSSCYTMISALLLRNVPYFLLCGKPLNNVVVWNGPHKGVVFTVSEHSRDSAVLLTYGEILSVLIGDWPTHIVNSDK